MEKSGDTKIKSSTEAKKEFSKIVKEVNETGEPIFISNHNKPEAVLLSNDTYKKLIEIHKEWEDKLFYIQSQERINKGSGRLIPTEIVIKESGEPSPFVFLSDDELFD